jgi:uncharacterized protein
MHAPVPIAVPRRQGHKGSRGGTMPVTTMIALVATMVATAFLSGIFGMAGGLILIGVLFALLPVPEAMSLHAVTQMASNGWRGVLWIKYVSWRAVAAYLGGCLIAFILWSLWRYVPDKATALLALGITPFLVRLVPATLRPDPQNFVHGGLFGAICMTLMLLTGVTGPILDTYFLGGGLERRQIIATKAICQVFGHGAKFVYFGGLVAEAASVDPLMAILAVAASIVGTSAAKPVLERLTDTQYRSWTTHIVTVIAGFYVAQGLYLLLAR